MTSAVAGDRRTHTFSPMPGALCEVVLPTSLPTFTPRRSSAKRGVREREESYPRQISASARSLKREESPQCVLWTISSNLLPVPWGTLGASTRCASGKVHAANIIPFNARFMHRSGVARGGVISSMCREMK